MSTETGSTPSAKRYAKRGWIILICAVVIFVGSIVSQFFLMNYANTSPTEIEEPNKEIEKPNKLVDNTYVPSVTKSEYTVTLEDKDIIGPIVLFPNHTAGCGNVIVKSREPIFHPRSVLTCSKNHNVSVGHSTLTDAYIPSTNEYVHSVNGFDETITWQRRFRYNSINMACFKGRINTTDECLIATLNNSIVSINATTGKDIWKKSWNDDTKLDLGYKAFPVMLPDLNADGAFELAVIVDSSKIIIFSGLDGAHLKEQTNENCSLIENLNFTSPYDLCYTCNNRETADEKQTITMNLSDYFDGIKMNIPIKPIQYEEQTTVEELAMGEFTIRLQNIGESCPIRCFCLITIFNGTNIILMNQFEPAIGGNIASYNIHGYKGFMMKMWQHYPRDEDAVEKARMFHTRGSNVTAYFIKQWILFYLMKKDMNTGMAVNYRLEVDSVFMLCIGEECQPDYKTQRDSVFLSNLDGNDNPDLVIYFSGYRRYTDDQPTLYQLFNIVGHEKYFELRRESACIKKKPKNLSSFSLSSKVYYIMDINYIFLNMSVSAETPKRVCYECMKRENYGSYICEE